MSKPTATEKIIYQTTTPFQEIKLSRLSDGEVALYLDDAIQFVSGYDDRVYHGVLASYPARMLDGQPPASIPLGKAALRRAVHRDVHRRAVEVGRQMLERLLDGSELLEVHGGDLAVHAEERRARRIDEVDARQPGGVGEREAAQHDAVHHAEHRGDAADAEGQHGDGQRAESFLPREHAQTDAEIAAKTVGGH